MRPPPRQLILDLGVTPAYGREDFLVSLSNEAAYDFIEAWPAWPERRALLIGPPGAGKTHLAAIWADAANAPIVEAAALCEADVPLLLAGGALVLENADRIGDREPALFHLLNHARETEAAVLITARQPAALLPLTLADLSSRLKALPSVTIEAPDEALMRSVLVKLFVDRQLIVDTSVIDYIVLRMERSLEEAGRIVADLDSEALARGRRITTAMAGDVLRARQRPDAGEGSDSERP